MNILCDRCKKSNLPASIRYNEYDLCMDCTFRMLDILKYSGKIDRHADVLKRGSILGSLYEDRAFINISQNGKYYYPATAHYKGIVSFVSCDRCDRSNLLASIGFEKYDLCMKCNSEVLQYINATKSDITVSHPKAAVHYEDGDGDGYSSDEITRMAQHMYRPKPPADYEDDDSDKDEDSDKDKNSNIRTRMEQNMYKLKISNSGATTKMMQVISEPTKLTIGARLKLIMSKITKPFKS